MASDLEKLFAEVEFLCEAKTVETQIDTATLRCLLAVARDLKAANDRRGRCLDDTTEENIKLKEENARLKKFETATLYESNMVPRVAIDHLTTLLAEAEGALDSVVTSIDQHDGHASGEVRFSEALSKARAALAKLRAGKVGET